jgi:hypothetical protein
MQVGRDVGSAHCASEALGSSACKGFECWVQVGGEAQQLPGQQGRAGLLQDSLSVGGWSLGSDSFAWAQ